MHQSHSDMRMVQNIAARNQMLESWVRISVGFITWAYTIEGWMNPYYPLDMDQIDAFLSGKSILFQKNDNVIFTLNKKELFLQ